MSSIPEEHLESTKRLAAEVAFPELGDAVASAIDIAVQLLIQDVDHPSVVQAAALDPRATRADAEPIIRAMLNELGLGVPDGSNAASRYELLRYGVGFWNLPIAAFEGPFYDQVPAWEEQRPEDRALVQLLDRRDNITALDGRLVVDEQIREVARYADDAAVLARIEKTIATQDLYQPVRIPADLARVAKRAWLRDEERVVGDELPEQRLLRHQAATLALIGLAIDGRGTAVGDQIVVQLPPVDHALEREVLDSQLDRGQFVTADRLTLVSRVRWLDLEEPTFIQAGERYRVDWHARTVIVERLDGSKSTHSSMSFGPDSLR